MFSAALGATTLAAASLDGAWRIAHLHASNVPKH
jgi:hypothetical protein